MSSKPSTVYRIARALLLMTGMLAFLGPLLFMFISSLKPDDQILSDLRSVRALLPVGDISLQNYRLVLAGTRLPHYFFNSLIISGVTVALGLAVNSMAAFALERIPFRGNNTLLAAIIALLVIPFEVVAIPLMLLVSRMASPSWVSGKFSWSGTWFDTLHVQIVPFIANAFVIFLFVQAFRDVPRELDEAARMDGASWWRIYRQVLMPNVKPTIASASIVLFLGMWNQYLWPVLVTQGEDVRPAMLGIQQYFGQSTAWGQIMAYASILTVPVLLVFLFFQRRFVQSVVQSGIKG